MSNEILLDGDRYILAHDAAHLSGLTRDYVARLCRDGKVRGKRVGKNWYVQEDSLVAFAEAQERDKETRRRQLVESRTTEYRQASRAQKHIANPREDRPVADAQVVAHTTRTHTEVAADDWTRPVTKSLSAHASKLHEKLQEKALSQSVRVSRFAPSALVQPSGVHEALVRAVGHGTLHVPAYTITPFAEFMQKFVALLVAFTMTFGTYALVDPSYARFAVSSFEENYTSITEVLRDATGGGVESLATRSQGKLTYVAENPRVALAQASGATLSLVPNTLRAIARAINSEIDSFVYAIAFPNDITSAAVATRASGGEAVEVAPYARGAQRVSSGQRSDGSQAAFDASESVTIIERRIEAQNVVSVVGGISEEYLNQRLAALETNLLSRVLGSPSAGYTTVSNNYQVIAQSNNIDKLGSVAIDNSTFSGGTIDGSAIKNATITDSTFAGSVAATTLSASATSSLATTTISGDLTVSGNTTISGTLSIPGALSISSSSISLLTNTYATTSFISAVTASTTDLTWVNATGTNATTTNFFSTNASTTNATSTNLFASVARFTTALIDSLTSYGQLSAPSFSATSTTATSTFAGGAEFTRVPTLPHTFSSWSIGASNANPFDAALYVNPASAAGDTNLFAAAVGGSVKFLVDSEGDVFVNNLTSVGSVTLSTTTASTFTVEGNAVFGDSITDVTTVNGALIVTGTTTASTIQGNFGVGTSTPWARISIAGVAGGSTPLFTISSSTSGYATSTVFHIDSNGKVGIGTTSPSAKFAVDAPIYVGGSGATATSTFEGNVQVNGYLKVGTSSTYISNSTISTVGSLTVTSATTTNLFSSTASSTNLYSTSAQFGTLSLLNTLSTAGLATFQSGFVSQASSTVVGVFTAANNAFVGGTLGVGTSANDASAALQVDSTTGGFLPPRLTTVQKTAIGSPAAGLTVFDSTLNKLNVYNGTTWKNVGSTEINGEVTNGSQGSVLFIGDGGVLGQDNTNFTYSTSTSVLSTASLRATASSTIGGGTQASGLTIHGGATTTGDFLISKASAPTTGSIYFGSGTPNVTYNGSDFMFTGGNVYTAANSITAQANSSVLGLGARYQASTGTYWFGATNSASPDAVFSNNAGTERVRITDAGNVGIGTTTPWAALSIAGAAGGSTPLFTISSSTSGYSTSTVVLVDSSGNVGIGTANPLYALQVNGSIAPVSHLSTQNLGGASNYWGTTYTNELAVYNGSGVGINTTGSDLEFKTGSSGVSRLFIQNSSGNIGVGTTSPWAKLAISANSGETNTRLFDISSSTASATTSLFTVLNTGSVGIGTSAPSPSTGSRKVLQIEDSTNGTELRMLGDSSVTTIFKAVSGSGYAGTQTTSDFNLQTSNATRMTITGTGGNVGIGTTTPNTNLNVYGSSPIFTLDNTNASGLGWIQFSENSAIKAFIKYRGTTNTPANQLQVGTNSSGGTLALQTGSASTALYIDSVGNVGVGTTSPYSRLTTWGTGSLFEAVTNSSSTVFSIGQSGATTTGFAISSLASSLLSTNANGSVVATTSIGTNLLTGTLATINGTAVSANGSATVTAASSTLLANNNTWTGLNTFANATTTLLSGTTAWFTNFVGNLTGNVTGNASTATALQSARTINGTSFDGTANITITAASSTLLSDNSIFSGSNTFSAPLTLSGTTGTTTIASGQGFTVGSSQFVVQQGSGYVGIGTTSPLAIFDVYGDAILSGASRYLNFGGTAGTNGYGFRDNGGTMQYKNSGGAWANISSGGGASITGSVGQLPYFSATDTLTATSSIFLATTGYVGVGTTTPNSLLTLVGASSGGYTSGLSIARSGNLSNQWELMTASDDSFYVGKGSGASKSNIITINTSGNVGIGTTSPFRKLSVTDAVSTAQTAIAYDSTRNTDLLTDSSGDFIVNPSGDDVRINDDNLWVCASGSCPTGTPTGTGNLIVETRIGVGTSTPLWPVTATNSTGPQIALTDGTASSNAWTLRSISNSLYIATSTASATSSTPAVTITPNGYVGIGTTSPSKQFSTSGLLFVGANGASTLGTATSTFYGDIKIVGKLDVSTIDPVYTIDGIKFATYGHSTVGIKEETVQLISLTQAADGTYAYTIDFNKVEEGSDLWLFYQITDLGASWQHLVVSLTPSFAGDVYYEKDASANTLTIYGDRPGEVSMRLVGNRYDFSKWPNLRSDQDGDTNGTHVISSKPTVAPEGVNIVDIQ